MVEGVSCDDARGTGGDRVGGRLKRGRGEGKGRAYICIYKYMQILNIKKQYRERKKGVNVYIPRIYTEHVQLYVYLRGEREQPRASNLFQRSETDRSALCGESDHPINLVSVNSVPLTELTDSDTRTSRLGLGLPSTVPYSYGTFPSTPACVYIGIIYEY